TNEASCPRIPVGRGGALPLDDDKALARVPGTRPSLDLLPRDSLSRTRILSAASGTPTKAQELAGPGPGPSRRSLFCWQLGALFQESDVWELRHRLVTWVFRPAHGSARNIQSRHRFR